MIENAAEQLCVVSWGRAGPQILASLGPAPARTAQSESTFHHTQKMIVSCGWAFATASPRENKRKNSAGPKCTSSIEPQVEAQGQEQGIGKLPALTIFLNPQLIILDLTISYFRLA